MTRISTWTIQWVVLERKYCPVTFDFLH